ncbi:hypothetical protein RHSIM_Rhsim10G0200400 [Rhododendron simsii]|uniref:Trichome birefringence-like C-terminal domain-containing protein n=1 Tax=Rhododendron simsii TaxID=118357 RepID=A0A834GC35_RHOSS|nr:hypothetical protein RHSIM_Rhsim10G0200400 [Rhododendron simsii]
MKRYDMGLVFSGDDFMLREKFYSYPWKKYEGRWAHEMGLVTYGSKHILLWAKPAWARAGAALPKSRVSFGPTVGPAHNPRFNAEAMLEMLRGKRLVFVGDSLNRNQWVSMVCLVDASIPLAQKSVNFELNGSLFTFKATEYNASIDFYWAPLLVESNCDGPYDHRIKERIVRVQAIEKHARHWTNADILVFNSYIWWTSHKMKIQWGSFESPGEVDGDYLEAQRIYEMAVNTWSDWLETRVNRTKTRLFFVSFSPTHERAEEWGKPADQNCYNETEPISKEGYWGRGLDPKMMRIDPKMMRIVEKSVFELRKKGVEIQILNITQLSEYRKDAHSSIYRKHWSPLTKEQLAKPQTYADCIHWCLPGVPDVWNELLYAHLQKY